MQVVFVTCGGDREYARSCFFDSHGRGELSLFPGVIFAAFDASGELDSATCVRWLDAADVLAVYTARGLTHEMRTLVRAARSKGVAIEVRDLSTSLSHEDALFLLGAELPGGA